SKLIETAKWLETEGLKHPVDSALAKAGIFPA
ncbi:MAG: hydroxymethylglutaryl-CoA lyase, partial [Sphingomonadales bacterium CG12_big_fil_rev_8_21_14_0_65_65_10]